MERSKFKYVCDAVRNMCVSEPGWRKKPSSIIADFLKSEASFGYGLTLRELLGAAFELIEERTAFRVSAGGELELEELACRLMSRKKIEGYKYTAYLFALSVAAVCTGNASADDVDCDLFDSNELIAFDAGMSVAYESDPVKKRLKKYRIRLLDFSHGNPLVNFKATKKSSAVLFCADHRATLREIMGGKRIKLAGWKQLDPLTIYKCKICGRTEFGKYDFNAKKVQGAAPCPVCDEGNLHNRKSMAPVKEFLTVIPDEGVVCECGEKISPDELKRSGKCPACGKAREFTTFPLVTASELNVYKSDEMIPAVGDNAAKETFRSVLNTARSMERNFGLHVLYLAYGFLDWKDVNGTEYHSPLLLCPINIGVDKNGGTYYLEAAHSGGFAFEVNKTLVNMLAVYSPTLSLSLPEADASNVYSYLTIIKQYLLSVNENALAVTAKWKVSAEFGVGLFHYQKLQLQHDIETNVDKYLGNPLIRRLCKDTTAQIDSQGDKNIYSTKYILMDADSSQEEVIAAAQSGRSFILQGPPGSGKSQTITNIVASALGAGKTVLFVTEKATARSVIIDNLNKCRVNNNSKLTEFVLDFENFKKRGGAIARNAFVDELNKNLTSFAPVSGYDDELLAKESNLRRRVREYMNEMCNEYDERNYMRIMRDAARYVRYDDLRSSDGIPQEWSKVLDLCDALSRFYSESKRVCGGIRYKDDALYGCKGDAGNALYTTARKYLEALNGIERSLNYLAGMGWVTNGKRETLYKCADMAELWSGMPVLPEAVLSASDEAGIAALIERAHDRTEAVKRLEMHEGRRAGEYIDKEKFASFDLAKAEEELTYFRSPFRRIGRAYGSFLKNIFSCFKNKPYAVNYKAAYDAYACLTRYKAYTEAVRVNEVRSREDRARFGFVPSGISEWQELYDKLCAVREIVASTDRAILDIHAVGNWLKRFSSGSYARFVLNLKQCALTLRAAADDERALRDELSKYFEKGSRDEDYGYPGMRSEAETVCDNRTRLSGWKTLTDTVDEIVSSGCGNILNELTEDGTLTFEAAEGRIYKSYYRKLLDTFARDNGLRHIYNFDRPVHEQLIGDYSRTDLAAIASAPRRLYDRLRSSLKVAASQRLGKAGEYLKIQSKTDYSVKRTISENWDYVKYIKPCFMMSPLNVSQYVDVDIKFDLVIFDEASQIFTEDALAAIMRGRQVIIAGDSKQLPPSDFFRAGDAKQDDDDVYYDEEANQEHSLLEAAAEALNDASIALTWHYRSADESLIAFSNEQMDYNLITFPSAVKNVNDGIRYYGVPYDPAACYVAGKGGAHINPGEADKAVELIYAEMTHPERHKFSIGVVAFSNAQASEIEMRWEAFKQHPLRKPVIEQWEKEHEEEPLIFCNLDTVQGDERDTIVISVCYSADADGKFILPYLGRIRLLSGKKRLNVAVTRARHQMLVVAMLDSLTLAETIRRSSAPEENKAGAKMLYDFLEYARSSGAGRESVCSEAYDPVVRSVCEALQSCGVEYATEIGRSECKIDVGIRDPQDPENFVLGIIVDDPGRADFDSVREYTRLTEQVLTEKYGWKIYRIYPVSWMNGYADEKTALLGAVNKAIGK